MLDERNEDLKGRQLHNGDERLLSGTMKCGLCGSHMFGGGGCKNGKHIPYYVCSKRYTQHECEQGYMRADIFEAAVIQDIKGMLRDEQFMARIRDEANRRLSAEKPDIDKEILKIEGMMAMTRGSLNRYFEAFEAGTMKPALCNEKIEDLNARMTELEGERKELEVRRERLSIPEIDKAMLGAIVDDFEEVMASGTNPQKKHLLKRLVKKALVHDRRTIEIWYRLPNPKRFENRDIWLPGRDSNPRPGG